MINHGRIAGFSLGLMGITTLMAGCSKAAGPTTTTTIPANDHKPYDDGYYHDDCHYNDHGYANDHGAFLPVRQRRGRRQRLCSSFNPGTHRGAGCHRRHNPHNERRNQVIHRDFHRDVLCY